MIKKKKKPPKRKEKRTSTLLAKEGLRPVRLEVSIDSLDNIDEVRARLPGYKEMHPRTFQKLILTELGTHPHCEEIIKRIMGVK